MRDLERRLAQALSETADLVPERNPAALPAVTRRFRFPVWAAPLVAALSVLLLVAGIGWYGRSTPDPVLRIPSGAPAFFGDIPDTGGFDKSVFEIRSTRTGEVIDSREPSSPGTVFTGLAGRGDGRSFVLTEQRGSRDSEGCGEAAFSRVSVSADGSIESITPEVLDSGRGRWLDGSPTAWSSDGRWLAVALQPCDGSPGKIVIRDLTQQATAEQRIESGGTVTQLAWGPGGELYFVGSRGEDGAALWMRGTGSGDLFAISTRTRVLGEGKRSLIQVLIDPDGRSVVAAFKTEHSEVCPDKKDQHKPDARSSGECRTAGETAVDVDRVSLDGRVLARIRHEESADTPYFVSGDGSGRNFLLNSGFVDNGIFTRSRDGELPGWSGLAW